MREIVPTWIIAAAASLVIAVGGIDAAVSGEWDLLVVFALAFVLVASLSLRTRRRRTIVTLRPDLARWAVDHAYRTGETRETILDRAVAAHRRRVDPEEGHTAVFRSREEGPGS